tara:strand:+ start:946 stop:1137 length:192 start_codon:yes stop_codon:yes gene_type:complete
MTKTPIEIKLMNDLKFLLNLNQVKTKENLKQSKIIKEQNILIKEYLKELKELKELKLYPLHQP